jgi:hypothetical protein
MLTYLPAPVTGALMLVLLVVHTVLWASIVYVAIFLKILAPRGPARDAASCSCAGCCASSGRSASTPS